MTNEELVKLIQDGRNPKENLSALWNQNKRFAWSAAAKYRKHADIDDLMQQSYIGLHEAAYRYDPECGMKFLSYAGIYMNQQIWEYINGCSRMIRIPRHIAEKRVKCLKIQDGIKNKFGRDATDEEICIALDITYDQLDLVRYSFTLDSLKSLDEKPGGANDEDDISLSDCVASGQDIEEEVTGRIQCAELKEYINKIPKELQEIVQLHYYKNMNMLEIADALELKPYTARAMKAKALAELKRFYEVDASSILGYGNVSARAMKGIGVERFNRTWTSATERVAMNIYD